MNLPKLRLSKKLYAILSATLILVLAYSCRKDHATSNLQPALKDNSLVADAQAWYQKNAPVLTAATSTVRTLDVGESRRSWSNGLSPLWGSAFTFKRGNNEVAEAPLNNATLYFLENQTSAAPATPGKNYTKTEFLFIRNQAGSFSACLMVIMGDPAYVDNPGQPF
ncbi:hypothetical protein GCM10027037_32140 [Mucilaginibacter koreensis]